MAHRAGWKESKLKLSPEMDRLLRMVSLARRHSMDTICRDALRAYAASAGVVLEGGGEVEIMRRRAHTLMEKVGSRFWFTFPGSWHEPLESLARSHDGQDITSVVRAALRVFLPAQEQELAARMAEVEAELLGPARTYRPRKKVAA